MFILLSLEELVKDFMNQLDEVMQLMLVQHLRSLLEVFAFCILKICSIQMFIFITQPNVDLYEQGGQI